MLTGNDPVVIQIRPRTLIVAAALAAAGLFGLAALGGWSGESESTSAFATWEYKIVKPGEYAEVEGIERELTAWGKDGYELPANAVIARMGRAAEGRTNFRLEAGNGDFLVLRRAR
jgi:hypothetical protein